MNSIDPTRLNLVVPAPEVTALSVAGETSAFPVGRVFCIGRNYRWSVDEPLIRQEMPSWFMKPANAVVPARGILPYPKETNDLCHEVELVVAIGCGGESIDPALVEGQHIWGYAVGLDLTRRDLQQLAKRSGAPWEPSKAFDSSAPCSALVPAKTCGHPRNGAIWLNVNGAQRQCADLAGLIWPVSELVAMLSRSVLLRAGDLIFTGTPAGVGPLQPGDFIEAGITGIGEFNMTVGLRSSDTPQQVTLPGGQGALQ